MSDLVGTYTSRQGKIVVREHPDGLEIDWLDGPTVTVDNADTARLYLEDADARRVK